MKQAGNLMYKGENHLEEGPSKGLGHNLDDKGILMRVEKVPKGKGEEESEIEVLENTNWSKTIDGLV